MEIYIFHRYIVGYNCLKTEYAYHVLSGAIAYHVLSGAIAYHILSCYFDWKYVWKSLRMALENLENSGNFKIKILWARWSDTNSNRNANNWKPVTYIRYQQQQECKQQLKPSILHQILTATGMQTTTETQYPTSDTNSNRNANNNRNPVTYIWY